MIAANNQVYKVQCEHCGIAYSILANEEDMFAWLSNSGYIQDLMPYLTAAERELLISGTCDYCWKLMHGENDEV
jgi:hypothetical protein